MLPAIKTVGRRAAILALALGLLAVWLAVMSVYRPAACIGRALAALGANDIERLQYETIGMPDSGEFQYLANLFRGRLLLAGGHPDLALDELEIALRDPDIRIRAMVLRGECLYWMGRFSEAGKTWTQVVQLAPDNVDAHRWLGVAYYELGASRDAIYFLDKAAGMAPSDPRPHRTIGLIRRDEDPSDAIKAYQESLRRQPDQSDRNQILFELADAHHRLRQYPEALAVLRECPLSADVLTLRADCEMGLSHTDEALALLEQALAADPDQITALVLEAKIMIERGKMPTARRLLEHAAELAPKDGEIRFQLAIVYRRLDELDKAAEQRRLFDQLRTLRADYDALAEKARSDPRDEPVRRSLGMLAIDLEMPAAAKTWLRSALYLDPNDTAAMQALLRLLADEQRALLQSKIHSGGPEPPQGRFPGGG